MPVAQLSVYFFLQIAVIIAASQLVGRLAQRVGQPQVVGEMIAGVLLGPSLFGLFLPEVQKALFPKETLGMLYVGAQLGVGLYMFLVGTEFRADHFRNRFRSAASVSAAGIAVPFVLAFMLTPWLQGIPGLFAERVRPFEAALFMGASIAITAFPMLARIIQERGLAGTSSEPWRSRRVRSTMRRPGASSRSCWPASVDRGRAPTWPSAAASGSHCS